MPEGAGGLVGVVEVGGGVEHHAVERGVGQRVGEVSRAECGQIPDRIVGGLHLVEAPGEPGEAFLADGTPEARHAVEVGVDGHRRRARSGDEGAQGDRFAAGEHLGRPLDEHQAECWRRCPRHSTTIHGAAMNRISET